MNILDHPAAEPLLKDAELSPAAVRSCADHLTAFIQRYLPRFHRQEQRDHADTILRGLLTGLERKTTEPLARQAGQPRRPLQLFVGAGGWNDQAVLAELRSHVRAELAHADAVLVVDGYGVPKKGEESCGVTRQWCGHLGKVDNCQVGYVLAYVAPRGKALLDGRLYVPEHRAADPQHRAKTHVPADVVFQEGWRLSLGLVRQRGRELPHGWVTGDDEFGRASEFRAALRFDKERYVLDVPRTTTVRDLSARRPAARPGGRERRPEFESVQAWAARQPKGRWRTFTLPGGEKGPRRVRALQQWVQTKEGGGDGRTTRAASGHPELCVQAADLVYVEQRTQRDSVGAGSQGPRLSARGGGIVARGEWRSGDGPVRGAQLGGLAPPPDAVAAGLVVPATGAVAVGKKKRGR